MWEAQSTYKNGSTNMRVAEAVISRQFTDQSSCFYTEEYPTIEEAYKRERQLHGWSKAKKEALICGDIERLKQLSNRKR